MAPKRRANASSMSKGLLPGEQLNRNNILSSSSPWGWVGNAVTDEKDITLERRLATCGLSSKQRACCNKYSIKLEANEKHDSLTAAGELDDDIIVISDDEGPSCSRKGCKSDPNCLNYLGQQAWENEDGSAQKDFFKAMKQGSNPSKECREEKLPVGLKNLGATCYANASLQVWYRDLAFRSGVYNCEPPENVTEEKYKDSPIFQLQATFAALQEGNKNIFNPIKLVESLQLRTTEQQDAQEFSKLFISHLDAEFKKQPSPAIKTLITDQFQGSQIYGTICHACKNRSERPCDFLELEISFTKNADLKERLEASLSPEQLSGDNKYFCSRCNSLQDATRYTQLQRLPPVLHFSLLRFVYDLNTMERKKSKHSISFPSTLNMRKFMGSKNDRERPQEQHADDDVYELRGILLHKGSSAYHGHYEAQVHDFETGSWFQFNDDVVTKIDSLGDKVVGKKLIDRDADLEEEHISSQLRQSRTNGRKRRRIKDSDEEDNVEILETPLKPKTTSSIITSRDAYMLIYSKKVRHQESKLLEDTNPTISTHSPPVVPDRVMDVIRKYNAAHEEACRAYQEKATMITTQYQTLRSKVRSIYMNWTATNHTESAIVSRQALEAWLSEHCIEAATYERGVDGGHDPADNPQPVHISNSDIVCEHGALDPTKSKDMKRIALHSMDDILKETRCAFEPLLKPPDVCVDCVSLLFREKLYDIEHPRIVKRLDECNLCHEGEMGYWISKKWLKDWRLNKPRMHVSSEPDPAPNSSEFLSHVICEHGGLSMNTINRRKISSEAAGLLRHLFPDWNPISSNSEMCAICDAEILISKEDKKEGRRRVEEEKALLKFIYEPPLEFWTNDVKDASCALIPADFVRRWNRWVANPCLNNPRPESVDNSSFFCEHELLCFDPNCAFDMNTFITIQRDQWDTLQTLYRAGPLISLTRHTLTSEGEFDHDISICSECRLKRKMDWQITDITIRLVSSKKTDPSKDSQTTHTTYTRKGGARQSKRLRQNKLYNGQRTLKISKSTTVRDLKIMVTEEFSIPIILQRLYRGVKELDDNEATASSIGIFANDVLDVHEIEDVDADTDTDTARPRKRRREEAGFGGTLLANVDSSWSSSPEPVPSSSLPITQDKPCLVCTFSNTLDALSCEMCETRFS